MKTGQNKSRIKKWGQFVLSMGAVWICISIIGPWGEAHLPVFKDIVETIDAQGIDSGAYFYSEIEESYTAQREISESLGFAAPDQAGFSLVSFSGIALCLLILFFGFRRLP